MKFLFASIALLIIYSIVRNVFMVKDKKEIPKTADEELDKASEVIKKKVIEKEDLNERLSDIESTIRNPKKP